MRENERGPEDSVDDIKTGDRVGDNKVPTQEGFLPVHLLGKGDEVAGLVDSYLTGKRMERSPIFLGNAESSFNRDLGVSVSAFPHLKLTTTAWLADGGGGGHPR